MFGKFVQMLEICYVMLSRATLQTCLRGVVHREHQHFCLRGNQRNLARRCHSVHNRHLQIENYNIGTEFFYFLDSHCAVLRLATNVPITVPLDGRAHQAADYRTIIDDKNGVCQNSPASP